MARYDKERAANTNSRKARVSPQQASAGTRRRNEFEAGKGGATGRFDVPAADMSVGRAAENQAVSHFQNYLNVGSASTEHDGDQLTFLSTHEGKSAFTPAIEHEAQKRHAETLGAAEQLGSPGARWEDFSSQQQQRVLNELKRYGVTHDSAHRAFSSQLTQAVSKGQEMSGQTGTTQPYASPFYFETGYHGDESAKPRQQIIDTARRFGVGFHVAATAHAMLSPQLPFEERSARRTVHHNDVAAQWALNYAKSGRDVEDITVEHLSDLHPNARSVEKMKEAVHVTRQLMQGSDLSEVRTRRGEDPFGPKTGPYLHAWLDPTADNSHMVIDTHTAMGFAPHLSKAAKDKMMGIAGVHAFFDHVGRGVMGQHGLNNVHWTQAAQWGQQRLHAGETNEHDAYVRPTQPMSHETPVKGQLKLFTPKKTKSK